MDVDLQTARVVQRGRAASLTLPLVSADGSTVTATSGTLTIRLGSRTLLDEYDLSGGDGSFGPPASYSLAASLTADEGLSDQWTEIWNLDVGEVVWTGFLVRHAYRSTVTDTALQKRHPEILSLLPPGESTAEKYRTAAVERVERMLLQVGRRPHLVFDRWALHDLELYHTVAAWAADTAMRVADPASYLRLAADYERKAELEWSRATFRYDDEEDGIVDDEPAEAAAPMVVLSAGPGRRRRR